MLYGVPPVVSNDGLVIWRTPDPTFAPDWKPYISINTLAQRFSALTELYTFDWEWANASNSVPASKSSDPRPTDLILLNSSYLAFHNGSWCVVLGNDLMCIKPSGLSEIRVSKHHHEVQVVYE